MAVKEGPVSVVDEEKTHNDSEQAQTGSEAGSEVSTDVTPRKIHGLSVCFTPSLWAFRTIANTVDLVDTRCCWYPLQYVHILSGWNHCRRPGPFHRQRIPERDLVTLAIGRVSQPCGRVWECADGRQIHGGQYCHSTASRKALRKIQCKIAVSYLRGTFPCIFRTLRSCSKYERHDRRSSASRHVW